ncbi:GST N-terminal domain-containing protein [Mycena venus]|uniref:GST N-terminal domain-containing protein n=1 Tax=Mycena venus TaxID=2733690 RepID=A0A8H7CKW2_9AGAR|nr:GST N-terminal domain-containing protein [Mycena venus]
MTKTLYVFTRSVWASVAELAVAELGYKEGEVTFKSINLVESENLAPSFLKINPNGTLPTLESDGQVYKSTAEVTAALVKDAPIKVKPGSEIIETIHDAKYDPNFALFLARNDTELAFKRNANGGFFEVYVNKRKAVLDRLSADPEAEALKAFYEPKKTENDGLLALFTGKASEEHKAGFFASSQAHFDRVKGAVFEVLPGFLPDSGFIDGEAPGDDDFHVVGWLTRIAASTGATSADDGLATMEAAYGAPVPAKVATYWGRMDRRTAQLEEPMDFTSGVTHTCVTKKIDNFS